MNTYEINLTELLAIAEDEHINVVNYHFSPTKKAASMAARGFREILLDKPVISGTEEECELMMEEVGHLQTDTLAPILTSFNEADARAERLHAEGKQSLQTVKRFIPIADLQALLATPFEVTLDDMRRHFGVSAAVLDRALSYYTETGQLNS